MKILVLSYEYPPLGGGGGMICKNISENLAKQGNEITVLTTAYPLHCQQHSDTDYLEIGPETETDTLTNQDPGSEKPGPPDSSGGEEVVRNLRIIRVPSLRRNTFQSNPMEMLSWIRITKRFIRKNHDFVDCELCMAHFVLPGGEVALWLKKKFGLPYVLISHGHEIPWVHPRQMILFHALAYFRIKSVCKKSELNFIQTGMMKANLDRFLGRKYEKKNVIIPNGVNTVRFYPDYSQRPGMLRILFAGRLVIQKDPFTFLKAILMFSKEKKDFEVHIAGDGNLRPRMERFVARNGLIDHVTFLGKVSQDEMVGEYQATHVMVAPSLSEGMSIAALEALSCGCYLIATHASGYDDMIKEGVNGEFVRFRDPENIHQKLKGFYEKKKEAVIVPQINVHQIPKIYGWKAISGEYSTRLDNLLR